MRASSATSSSTRSPTPTPRRIPRPRSSSTSRACSWRSCARSGSTDVELTEHGYVFATVPGTVASAPTVGLIAHVDTAPGTSGTDVRPIVHRGWAGEAIQLPGDPKQVLDPAEMPGLADRVGHDLVTSDGTTLLGADDKAGVAIIVTAADRLLRDDRPRATLRVAFTVDEEVGRGTDHFDLEAVRRGLRVHVRRVGARRARDGDVLRLPARAHDRRSRRASGLGQRAARQRAQADGGSARRAAGRQALAGDDRGARGVCPSGAPDGWNRRRHAVAHRARPRRREARGARRARAPDRDRGRRHASRAPRSRSR